MIRIEMQTHIGLPFRHERSECSDLCSMVVIGFLGRYVARLGPWVLREGGQDEVDGAPDGGPDQCLHAAEVITVGQAMNESRRWGQGRGDAGDIRPQETSGERQLARDHPFTIDFEPYPVKGLFVNLERMGLLCRRS